jgi:hypothetical protein
MLGKIGNDEERRGVIVGYVDMSVGIEPNAVLQTIRKEL